MWRRSGGIIEVALKTLNLTTSPKDAKVKLLQEAAVMAQFRHPNVILLHGVVIEQQNVRLPWSKHLNVYFSPKHTSMIVIKNKIIYLYCSLRTVDACN